jgi:hypothetical protein
MLANPSLDRRQAACLAGSVIQLTVLPDDVRHPLGASKFTLFDLEEIAMKKQKGLDWLRGAAESVFAGVIAAAVMTFIASGTLAMCMPGVLAA